MATNKVYVTPGASIVFQGTGGDILWTPQNEAAGKGRISAVWDRGAGSLPARYRWRMQTRWVATPAAGDTMRLYLVGSSASATAAVTDSGLTFGDAELSAETLLYYNCKYVGSVIASALDQPYSASGVVEIWDRYVALAMWNGSATKGLTNTVTDHIFTITEMPDDIQAAS